MDVVRVRILVSLLRIPEYFLVLEAAGCSSADLHLLVWYLVLITRELVCLLSPLSFFLFSPLCTVEHAVAEEIHFVNAHYFRVEFSLYLCIYLRGILVHLTIKSSSVLALAQLLGRTLNLLTWQYYFPVDDTQPGPLKATQTTQTESGERHSRPIQKPRNQTSLKRPGAPYGVRECRVLAPRVVEV